MQGCSKLRQIGEVDQASLSQIPGVDGSSATPAEPAAPDATAAVLSYSEQGETVLVVDDEPTVRMLVIGILEQIAIRWSHLIA